MFIVVLLGRVPVAVRLFPLPPVPPEQEENEAADEANDEEHRTNGDASQLSTVQLVARRRNQPRGGCGWEERSRGARQGGSGGGSRAIISARPLGETGHARARHSY
jgi:hypothetical protein